MSSEKTEQKYQNNCTGAEDGNDEDLLRRCRTHGQRLDKKTEAIVYDHSKTISYVPEKCKYKQHCLVCRAYQTVIYIE